MVPHAFHSDSAHKKCNFFFCSTDQSIKLTTKNMLPTADEFLICPRLPGKLCESSGRQCFLGCPLVPVRIKECWREWALSIIYCWVGILCLKIWLFLANHELYKMAVIACSQFYWELPCSVPADYCGIWTFFLPHGSFQYCVRTLVLGFEPGYCVKQWEQACLLTMLSKIK